MRWVGGGGGGGVGWGWRLGGGGQNVFGLFILLSFHVQLHVSTHIAKTIVYHLYARKSIIFYEKSVYTKF